MKKANESPVSSLQSVCWAGPLTLGSVLPFAAGAAECKVSSEPHLPRAGTLHNQGLQGSRRLFICDKQQSAKSQDYVKLVSIRQLPSHIKLSRAQDIKWLDGGRMSLDVFPFYCWVQKVNAHFGNKELLIIALLPSQAPSRALSRPDSLHGPVSLRRWARSSHWES